MEVTANIDLRGMMRILHSGPYLGVSGLLYEPRYRRKWRGAACVFDDRYTAVDSHDMRRCNGVRFIHCHYTMNWGLFNMLHLREYQWNEMLNLNEHAEFFWHIFLSGRHAMACTGMHVIHHHSRPNVTYNMLRNRASQKAKGAEIIAIGGRLKWRHDQYAAVRLLKGTTKYNERSMSSIKRGRPSKDRVYR